MSSKRDGGNIELRRKLLIMPRFNSGSIKPLDMFNDRRSFLASMLKAGAGAMILPGAGRVWRKSRGVWVVNPEWETAPYEIEFCMSPALARTVFIGRPEDLGFQRGPLPESLKHVVNFIPYEV